MRADQLGGQRVQRVEPNGVHCEPPSSRLVVWGIHGGSEFVTGIKFGETALGRAPAEEVEALRVRAMRDVVPNLAPDALRDSKGSAVGYFTYAGLPADHCRAVAEQEGKR
jgi:hypothetical protein